MKNITFVSLSAVLILFASCNEDASFPQEGTTDSRILSELAAYNASLTEIDATRGNPPVVADVDEETLDIVEQDLIGALEGAYKGFNYSIDHGLSQDEAVAVVLTSALTHGIARSHAAYIAHLHNTATVYLRPHRDYSNNKKAFREDIVSLMVGDEVKHSKWMISGTTRFDKKYPTASMAGRKHNAVLSVIDTVSIIKDYHSSLSQFDLAESEYLSGQYHIDSFNEIIDNPTNFQDIINVYVDAPDYVIKNITKLFLNAIDLQGRNVDDYKAIMNEYISRVENTNELSDLEKDCVFIAFSVGMYSMSFWTIEGQL